MSFGHMDLRQTYSFGPPVCATHDLCNTAACPDQACKPGHELCCRCPVAQDDDVLVLDVDTRVPASAMERVPLEGLFAFDVRNRRPVQRADRADNDVGFAREGLASELVLESASPLAPDGIPYHLEAHRVELSATWDIVLFGHAHEIWTEVSIWMFRLFGFELRAYNREVRLFLGTWWTSPASSRSCRSTSAMGCRKRRPGIDCATRCRRDCLPFRRL
jgi:hypothetical protein